MNSEVAGFFSSKWRLNIRDFVIVIYLNLNPSFLACLRTHQLHSRLLVSTCCWKHLSQGTCSLFLFLLVRFVFFFSCLVVASLQVQSFKRLFHLHCKFPLPPIIVAAIWFSLILHCFCPMAKSPSMIPKTLWVHCITRAPMSTFPLPI